MAEVNELSLQIVIDAGRKFLAETEDFPRDINAATDAEVLLASAAWLDFYDATFPIVLAATDLDKSWPDESSDELQRALRRMAAQLEQ